MRVFPTATTSHLLSSPQKEQQQQIVKKDISIKVIFAAQIGIIYLVVLASLINLSLKIGNSNLWVALLASSLGYILPAPTLQTHTNRGEEGSSKFIISSATTESKNNDER